MFTGIIEEVGIVRAVQNGHIEIEAKKVLEGTRIGDSIAVNGVCLTVTKMTSSHFSADVMNETFSRSNLSSLLHGDKVNLERAMSPGGRFGGHFVSGHIDGTGKIIGMENDGNAVRVLISVQEKILRLIIEKGSVAIDGISLTVAKVFPESFSVSVIPLTGKDTSLLGKEKGALVNIENDMIGKYVHRLMNASFQSQEERDEKILKWLGN